MRNDNEIIKALECCAIYDPKLNECSKCPYNSECGTFESNMPKDALDLINRQKAKIEKLTLQLEAARITIDSIKEDVSDYYECQIKELLSCLKRKLFNYYDSDIDELAAEVMGDNK